MPAYSAAEVVARSIAGLERAAAKVAEPVEIVVVLNRPLEGLVVGATTRFVEVSSNLGFAGGAMRGIREAEGEWVVVVNDDCVLEPDALAQIFGTPTTDRTGSVAGLIVFADRPGIVNAAGIDVDALGVASDRLVGRPVSAASERTTIFGGSGAFTLFRRRMLEELGGFDESFFAYLEDADLAWRAQMAGWECIFEPAARAIHVHSATLGHASPEKHFLVGRNRLRMLAKNATAEQLRRRGAAIVAYEIAYMIFAAIMHRTLAPVAGRLVGLREWRHYRAVGAATRRPVALSPPRGILAALQRNRTYRAVS